MKAILNYPGAKWGMAEMICNMMPAHRSYLEPFFGSGAVLFNKPKSPIETINDMDGDVTNFFKVLRDNPEELINRIALTPYARDVFDDAHNNKGDSELDRAYKFAIRSRMGHGFKTHEKTGFKIDVYARERSYCVDCWNSMPAGIREATLRLKQVQIENRPAVELIKRFNYDNVLIYADPPYMMETRSCKQYRFEMSGDDHIELLEALLNHKGAVILSGYDSELYNCMLKKWNKYEKSSYTQSSKPRTEVIWTNVENIQYKMSFD